MKRLFQNTNGFSKNNNDKFITFNRSSSLAIIKYRQFSKYFARRKCTKVLVFSGYFHSAL